MLDASLARLEAAIADDARVLDVGGWGKPLTRADCVVDLMPYETRGLYGRDGDGEERFTADSWIQRDICAREPWPFRDGEFDFVVCSHTLEDVRDPVFVCGELIRVARAGYIEVPSRLEEQSFGVQGDWVGWGHHHWLIDVEPHENRIEFVFKPHILQGYANQRFPAGFRDQLSEAERVQTLWWEGEFSYGERLLMSAEEVNAYLADFVAKHAWRTPPERRLRTRVASRLGR